MKRHNFMGMTSQKGAGHWSITAHFLELHDKVTDIEF